MQSKAIICKFHSSPTKNLAFCPLLSLFFHELITLQRQVQTIFYLIFLVIYFLLGLCFHFSSLEIYWVESLWLCIWESVTNFDPKKSLSQINHNLRWRGNNFVSILCAYSSSLWNSRNQTFDHQNLTTFWTSIVTLICIW